MVRLQRKTDLQQELLSTPFESHKHELESELAKTERNITSTVARIREYEEEIQRRRGGTDRKQSDKKQGELRVSVSELVHTASVREGQGRLLCDKVSVECLYR